MARLAQTPGLTEVQRDILATVREFVDKEIIPHAQRLEHDDEYPADIVDGMREMGLFGLTIAEEYGGLGESLLTYALVVEELVPRLDVDLRHRQHPLHRRVPDLAARLGRSRRRGCCRGWPPARCAARSRCPSPGCGSDVAGDPDQGRSATATTTSSTARRCG